MRYGNGRFARDLSEIRVQFMFLSSVLLFGLVRFKTQSEGGAHFQTQQFQTPVLSSFSNSNLNS